jgi:RNA polymerase sigma-70 factor, ECF subfamily
MSSETAYFPEALAISSEVRGIALGSSQISNDSTNEVPLQCGAPGHLINTAAPIAEILDELLLERVSQGEKEALGILFRRHARTVRNVACRILRDDAEADDLVQEVFLFLIRKAALFKPSHGTARSWIVQVAYHRAFDRRRQLIARHFYDALELDTPTAAARHTEIAFYEQSLAGRLGQPKLRQIADALSPNQHRTLQLYFFEGYTIEEISLEMGQPPGNVRNHYYRALEKIRKLIFTPKVAAK